MQGSSQIAIDDMIQLDDLHEGALLLNLYNRFQKDLVYTFIGNILVAVNPYKQLPIYDGEVVRQYSGQALGSLPPHIFAIANETYYTMLRTQRDQSVIIRYVASLKLASN
jgi:myosin heavy subunit